MTRQRIESVATTSSHFFVGAGFDGIDIYKVELVEFREKVTYVTNINHSVFAGLKSINVKKVKILEGNF